jgi:methylamine--corrinoid protein Co-methyltransferase
MAVSFWDVLDRTRAGEKVEEKAFDMAIFKTVQRLSTEYSIRYEKTQPVPSDDRLADAIFTAGLKFYAEVGTFCVSTGRVIRFTEEEIREGLAAAAEEIQLGEGKETIMLRHRELEEATEPLVFGGMQTGLYGNEESLYRISKATAEEPAIDGLWGGGLASIGDTHPIPSSVRGHRR